MFTKPVSQMKLIQSPYPHIAVENAVTTHDGMVADFPDESRFGRKIRMHGDLTAGDEEYERLINESAAYRSMHDWAYSEEFIKSFLEMFDEEIEVRIRSGELLLDPRTLPIKPQPYEGRKMVGLSSVKTDNPFLFPRLDLGIGKLNYGLENGGGGIHVDNLTRVVSVLIYIDDNATMVGGEHRLYRIDRTTPVIDKIYPAKPNFMVASLQSNMAFHDVNPVTAIEGFRKAMYLAVSCSTVIWQPHKDRLLQKLTKNRYRPSQAERVVQRVKSAIGF
jgi:hypothetical protein